MTQRHHRFAPAERIRVAQAPRSLVCEGRAAVRAQFASTEQGVAPPESLEVGDSVFVRSLGKEGQVLAVRGRGRVTVRVGGLEMQLKVGDLAPGHGRGREGTIPASGGARSRTPAPTPSRPPRARQMETGQEVRAVRLDHNTVDLRGQRVDAELALVEQHIEALVVRGESLGFGLHGQGTGALRQRCGAGCPRRNGPPLARNAEEGGDAFTVIELG